MIAPFPMLTGKGNGTAVLVVGALIAWAFVAHSKRLQGQPSAPALAAPASTGATN